VRKALRGIVENLLRPLTTAQLSGHQSARRTIRWIQKGHRCWSLLQIGRHAHIEHQISRRSSHSHVGFTQEGHCVRHGRGRARQRACSGIDEQIAREANAALADASQAQTRLRVVRRPAVCVGRARPRRGGEQEKSKQQSKHRLLLWLGSGTSTSVVIVFLSSFANLAWFCSCPTGSRKKSDFFACPAQLHDWLRG